MVPWGMWVSWLPATWASPHPVTRDPGSMPRMLSRSWSVGIFRGGAERPSARLFHQLRRNVEIGGHALHIVVIFKFFGQFQDLLDMFGVDVHRILRHHGNLSASHGDFFPVQPLLHFLEVLRLRHHLEEIVLV